MELEIGCPIGSIRPDYYINLLINELVRNKEFSNETKKIILSWKKQYPISKLFGEWTYELNISKDLQQNEKVRNIIFNFLNDLYNDNCIRYGRIVYI